MNYSDKIREVDSRVLSNGPLSRYSRCLVFREKA